MLRQKLQQDQLTALKSQNKETLEVLRFVISEIKNKEIEKKAELNDEETILVLKKFAKELKESIEAFEKGNRTDLVTGSKKQLDIISRYLPAEMTDEELKKEIDKIIADNKETYEQNQKAIIGICMKALRAKADPGRIMKMISSYGNS